jgi:type VI secretion system secreted protein Hcp
MAFDAFLKLDGIEGESTDKSHPGEIEVASFSWGVTNTGSAGSGGGGGAGKAVLQDFHFQMATSKASPNLMLACAVGAHLRTATLTCRKAGGDKGAGIEFLKIKLFDCLVSSYELAGDDTAQSTSPDSPTDSMSLNFVKIDFLYTTQRGETVETSFDAGRNGPGT